jgi:arginine-tRNA-protein transferase
MYLLQKPKLDTISSCSYLANRTKQFQYFFAKGVSEFDISFLLAQGWRKFGFYYFRPMCPNCRECIPLRVLVNQFKPSKSQRRSLKRNEAIRVEFGPLVFSQRAFEIYQDHSQYRFDQESNLENFLTNFYTLSCPGLQSEYYLDDRLIAIGYLDRGVDCLSSVYFVYDTSYTKLGLGTFSILKEIEYTKTLGLSYYYLGYYIRDCHSMSYKDRFKPREHFNWSVGEWDMPLQF